VLEVDGRRLLVSMPITQERPRGGLTILGADRRATRIFEGDVDEAIALAPGGKHAFAVVSRPTGDTELYAVALDGSGATSLASAGIAPGKGFALSPDGRHVVWSTCSTVDLLQTLDRDGHLHSVEGSWIWSETDAAAIPGTTHAIVLSARGGTRQPWLFDLAAPAVPLRALATPGLTPTRVAISDDGAWLAFSTAEKGIHVMPLDGSAPPRALTASNHDVRPTFLHASHDVVYESSEGDGHPRIFRVSLDGVPSVLVDADARAPAASPIDSRIAYLAGANNAELVPMLLDPMTNQMTGLSTAFGPGGFREIRFSPDARRIVLLRKEPEIVEVEVETGTVLRTQKLPEEARAIAFLGGELVLTIRKWAGNLWMADKPF
jgi:Tol biopolymer transport system component